MIKNAKIHLRIGEIEITIEGTSDFVSDQYQEIINGTRAKKNETITKISKSRQKTTRRKSPKSPNTIKKKQPNSNEPPSNQESYNNLLNSLTNREKVLLTAYYITFNRKDNLFSINELRQVLREKGMEILSAAKIIKDNAFEERIIKPILDDGKKYYKFTREGTEYMKELLAVDKK